MPSGSQINSSRDTNNADSMSLLVSTAFLLFFLLPDWLKLNHLKSRMECGFQTFFAPYLFHRSRNYRRDKLRSKFWREKMFRKPHLKLLRWCSVRETNKSHVFFLFADTKATGNIATKVKRRNSTVEGGFGKGKGMVGKPVGKPLGRTQVKLQLHYAIYRLRFYSNSLIHILSLSDSHNNVESIQKNRGLRLQLHGTIYHPDSFVLMLRYCANLKAIRYESTSLNRIVADKSHRVIAALGWF